MIIYFEGQSCAGKTSLISYLEANVDNVFVIEELPLSVLDMEGDISSACRENDLNKVSKAFDMNALGGLVLVDRCYLSSLCYHYTKFKRGDENFYKETLNRFMQKKQEGLLASPDLYVYMTIDKLTENERLMASKKRDRFKDIEEVQSFYAAFFSYIEFDIPVLHLNGEDTLESNTSTLISYLSLYLNYSYPHA